MDTTTLVIGASAAGLAVGARLRALGSPFEILEASDAVGQSWRNHYERLHLHTPKRSSALPGLAMPADWPRYVSRDQVVEYLERYAAHHQLVPHFKQRVTEVARDGEGWRVQTDQREWTAHNVVLCTGNARKPVRPTWPGMDTFTGRILHSSEYRNGEPWRGEDAVVVGFGNSACEQALDLAEHGCQVHMAVRSAVNVIKRDVFGFIPALQFGILLRPLPGWLADALVGPVIRLIVGDITKYGLRKLPYGPNTQMERDRQIPLLDHGTMDRIRSGDIVVHPNIARFQGPEVVFEDDRAVTPAVVVLGTGYRTGLEDFLPEASAVADPAGVVHTSGGPTALPGLYFCGMFTSPTGMLREIGRESERIARHISRRALAG